MSVQISINFREQIYGQITILQQVIVFIQFPLYSSFFVGFLDPDHMKNAKLKFTTLSLGFISEGI